MRPRHLQARGRRHEHDFDKERAREFADNGFLQRLKILARCGRSSSRRRTVRFFRTAREQISYGVLDPRCFANEGGTPIAEAIFKGGATFCVREFQHDPGRLEDLDTTREDHAPDDWRYACNSRPWAKPTPKKPGPIKPRWPTSKEVTDEDDRHMKMKGRRIRLLRTEANSDGPEKYSAKGATRPIRGWSGFSFNNPALMLLMPAGIHGYGFNWDLCADHLFMVSIGTGSYRLPSSPTS